MKRSIPVKINTFLLINLLFLPYLLHYAVPLHSYLLLILVNLIVFILPGLSWMGFFLCKRTDMVVSLFLAVCLSTAFHLLGILGHYVLGLHINSLSQLIFIIAVSNFGILVTKPALILPAGFLRHWKGYLALSILCLTLCIFMFYLAVFVVPPLEDVNLEIQATTYGLLHQLKPCALTDRGLVYYFAHPQLRHFYTGLSILFFDELDDMKNYYSFALQAQRIKKTAPLGEDSARQISELVRREYNIFYQQPHLLAARSANIFFSLISGLFLFYLTFYLTQSKAIGLLGVVCYFSFPELLVRTTSGSYTAISNFFLLIMAYLYIIKEREGCLFLSGLFAFLSSHKTVILPVAIAAKELGRGVRKLNSAITGFLSGIIIFCLYGILVDPGAFYADFIRYHLINRIFHINDLGYRGYPSIFGLWSNFNYSLGGSLPVWLLLLAGYLLTGNSKSKERPLLLLWFLIGAFFYSVVDWRVTKHLMLIIIPLVIMGMIFISKQKGFFRVCLWGITLFIIGKNLLFIANFIKDPALIYSLGCR